jgi:hypothetical protein
MMSLLHEQEVLNWGPVVLFTFSIIQIFGGISLVVAVRQRPVLLRIAIAGIYLGFTIGFLLFAKVFESAVNLVPLMLPEATFEGAVFGFFVPVLSYWGVALMATFCYKGIFPKKWEIYAQTMRKKSNK